MIKQALIKTVKTIAAIFIVIGIILYFFLFTIRDIFRREP
jgi:hypothetical protein